MRLSKATLGPMAMVFGFLVLGACATSGIGGQASNPFAGSGDSLSAQDLTQPYSIVFTGNTQGYLGPCGCSLNPKGGVERRYNFLQKSGYALAPNAIVVDTGNMLFASLRLDPAQKERLEKQARDLASAQKTMGTRVANVGHLDLAAGVDFIRSLSDLKDTWVSTNLFVDAEMKKPLFSKEKRMSIHGREIVFIGLTEDISHSGLFVKDPLETVQRYLKSESSQNLLVVLSDLSLESNGRISDALSSRAHVILGARHLSSLDFPKQNESGLELRSQIQGQQWAVLDMDISRLGQSKNTWFSRPVNEHLARRWASVQNEADAAVSQRRVQKELLSYKPGPKDGRLIYKYSVFDMDESYAGKNKLSRFESPK